MAYIPQYAEPLIYRQTSKQVCAGSKHGEPLSVSQTTALNRWMTSLEKRGYTTQDSRLQHTSSRHGGGSRTVQVTTLAKSDRSNAPNVQVALPLAIETKNRSNRLSSRNAGAFDSKVDYYEDWASKVRENPLKTWKKGAIVKYRNKFYILVAHESMPELPPGTGKRSAWQPLSGGRNGGKAIRGRTRAISPSLSNSGSASRSQSQESASQTGGAADDTHEYESLRSTRSRRGGTTRSISASLSVSASASNVEGKVKNPLTGRMIKVGGARYDEVFGKARTGGVRPKTGRTRSQSGSRSGSPSPSRSKTTGRFIHPRQRTQKKPPTQSRKPRAKAQHKPETKAQRKPKAKAQRKPKAKAQRKPKAKAQHKAKAKAQHKPAQRTAQRKFKPGSAADEARLLKLSQARSHSTRNANRPGPQMSVRDAQSRGIYRLTGNKAFGNGNRWYTNYSGRWVPEKK